MKLAGRTILILMTTYVTPLCGTALPTSQEYERSQSQGIIRSIRALNDFLAGAPSVRTPFSLVGVVTSCKSKSFVLLDETGATEILHLHEPRPRPGDRIRVDGWASVLDDFNPAIWDDHTIVTLGHAPVPPPMEVSLKDLAPVLHNRRTIVTTATVIDAFLDEIDADFIIILLKDGPKTLPVSLSRKILTVPEARTLIGCRISATGSYLRAIEGGRKYAGPTLIVDSKDDLRILDRSIDDKGDIPVLEQNRYRSPEEIAALGIRRAAGIVIAAWPPDRLILRRDEGDLINVRLADGEQLPLWGAHVTVSGFPETDRFRLGLARARVRLDQLTSGIETEPKAATISSIIRFENGSHIVCADDHGKSFRFRGILTENRAKPNAPSIVRSRRRQRNRDHRGLSHRQRPL